MKKSYLPILGLLLFISGCASSDKSEISTFTETIYASIGDKTIWSSCEFIDHNTPYMEGNRYPITPTSIYLSPGRILNKKDAKLITELPLRETFNQAGKEVLISVDKITPAGNSWLVIEEYLGRKDWNQGFARIIGLNIKTGEQRKITTGSYVGGESFRYMVSGDYVFWSTKDLDKTRESVIMNLLTGKKQVLTGVKFESNVFIGDGVVKADGRDISLATGLPGLPKL